MRVEERIEAPIVQAFVSELSHSHVPQFIVVADAKRELKLYQSQLS